MIDSCNDLIQTDIDIGNALGVKDRRTERWDIKFHDPRRDRYLCATIPFDISERLHLGLHKILAMFELVVCFPICD